MRNESLEWMEQSDADIKTATDCITSDNFYASAFFSHQGCEKALKSLYIIKKKNLPPKTHSLFDLGRELSVPEDIMNFLRQLAPDYLISRYPDALGGVPAKIYNLEMARNKLSLSKKVIAWAKSRIK